MQLQHLELWIDPECRVGPEAMAVDEWLLEVAEHPVLRVYRWQGAWGSIGYFGNLEEALRVVPDVQWVRRWTGGGTVDHRQDWTYSLIAPTGCRLAALPGAESYRIIHEALAAALAPEGLNVRLAAAADGQVGPLCFENPVGHDLVLANGRKLAGAGQRRTRRGLLHQGSVASPCADAGAAGQRAERLASLLGANWVRGERLAPTDWLSHKVRERYGNPAFIHRSRRRSGQLAGQPDGGDHG